MSNGNFAEKMKAAKESKKAKEIIELKAGDIIEADKDESIELDATQAAPINEQEVEKAAEEINDKVEIEQIVEEVVKEEAKKPVEITSSEIQVISSEFHNFGNALFEKDKPTFLTEKVLNDLEKMPNFNDLVALGVIKIGL